MQVGDLVECSLGIYGLGVVLNCEEQAAFIGTRITVQWFDPPRWCMLGGNISAHKPSNLEKICK